AAAAASASPILGVGSGQAVRGFLTGPADRQRRNGLRPVRPAIGMSSTRRQSRLPDRLSSGRRLYLFVSTPFLIVQAIPPDREKL
ncbi:MAG: hypothetical protein KDH19_06365, partial [Geminicoccaceae bacterium]|nr:hypothetical protein [Geminicoccaceae bacterium]